jgi:hypothetical protein
MRGIPRRRRGGGFGLGGMSILGNSWWAKVATQMKKYKQREVSPFLDRFFACTFFVTVVFLRKICYFKIDTSDVVLKDNLAKLWSTK